MSYTSSVSISKCISFSSYASVAAPKRIISNFLKTKAFYSNYEIILKINFFCPVLSKNPFLKTVIEDLDFFAFGIKLSHLNVTK